MVNVGFPEQTRYGFERVDVPRSWLPRRCRHQSKIYTESNHSDFWRSFGELSSVQTLAIYRPLLARAESAKSTQQDQKRDDRGREMFFLLRMAFWLGLVLVLLPRDKAPESAKAPQIGASEAISAATAAVSDMTQFCKRQPAACEVGGQAATAIGQRAQGGARKLYEIITEKRAPDHTGSIDGGADANPSSDDMASHDTLTPDDLVARWHVPPAP
jgi:hypothetical protein